MNTELGEFSVCYTITLRRTSKHRPERLWRAITDASEVSIWMGHPARIDLRPGGDYVIDFGRTNPGEFLDGVIIRVEPGRLLRYAWGTSVVNWTIEPNGSGCNHTFVHAGLAVREVPDEEGLCAGWHSFLEGLDLFLDGRAARSDADEKRRWNELKALYRPRLAAVVPLK